MAKRNGGIIGPDNVPAGPLGAAGGVWRLEDAFNYQKAGLWPVVLGYQIPNSVRFNSGSSDNLTRTFGTATNRRIFTISTWIKRSNLDTVQNVFTAGTGSGDAGIRFNSGNELFFYEISSPYSAYNYGLATSQLFRDVSAWYHILVAFDSTQATDTNRVKIYVNGSQVTALSSASYPSLNYDGFINNNISHRISGAVDTTFGTRFYNGYVSESYFIDGQALTPSSFGQTDSTTGIWIPKAYTGTYGTNGFYLKFANSASLGTDSSGNGNNFTVNNLTSVDQSYDSPTNNFNIMNPLDFGYNATANASFSEGNLKITGNTTAWRHAHGNIGISKGKWYYEGKVIGVPDGDTGSYIGWCDPALETTYNPGGNNPSYNFYAWTNQTIKSNTGSTGSYYSFTENDICGFALDLDNGKGYISKNGTFYNNGNTSSTPNTSSPDFTITISSSGSGVLVPCIIGYNDGGFFCNFGYPPYAANSYTDANGFGNFSYAVPSGYYSLCSKNLAVYG